MSRTHNVKRRRPFKKPRPRILIVCEGTKTERGYFLALRHTERSAIELDIEPGGVPKTLVEKAVRLKQSAEKEARRHRDDNLRYQHVWCVFDVDEHPNLADAQQQARDNGIDIAISNPCFELWILLHFDDRTAYIHRDALHHECVRFLPDYEKKVPFEKVHCHYRDAVRRATALSAWQKTRYCGCETNPWTDVYRLTELIKSFT